MVVLMRLILRGRGENRGGGGLRHGRARRDFGFNLAIPVAWFRVVLDRVLVIWCLRVRAYAGLSDKSRPGLDK